MSEKTTFPSGVTGINNVKEPSKPLHPRRCETCMHFEPPEPKKDLGQCLANYPVVVPVGSNIPGQIGATSVFPPMRPDQRCSLWKENLVGEP
jgi:hypothetical protein